MPIATFSARQACAATGNWRTEWGKVKPSDRKDHYDVSRARITHVMEQLATASGDVEELVAIKVSLYRRVVPLIVETTLTDVTRRYIHAGRGLASMLI